MHPVKNISIENREGMPQDSGVPSDQHREWSKPLCLDPFSEDQKGERALILHERAHNGQALVIGQSDHEST